MLLSMPQAVKRLCQLCRLVAWALWYTDRFLELFEKFMGLPLLRAVY